jgi:hypothetical protein
MIGVSWYGGWLAIAEMTVTSRGVLYTVTLNLNRAIEKDGAAIHTYGLTQGLRV